MSVAESVKALQKQGHTPCSPKALRRAHSMAVPPSSVSVNQARPVSVSDIISPLFSLNLLNKIHDVYC